MPISQLVEKEINACSGQHFLHLCLKCIAVLQMAKKCHRHSRVLVFGVGVTNWTNKVPNLLSQRRRPFSSPKLPTPLTALSKPIKHCKRVEMKRKTMASTISPAEANLQNEGKVPFFKFVVRHSFVFLHEILLGETHNHFSFIVANWRTLRREDNSIGQNILILARKRI